MEMPFDTITYESDQGTLRLSPDDFAKLPLPERVAAVLRNRLKFLHSGQIVDQRTALAALRQRSV